MLRYFWIGLAQIKFPIASESIRVERNRNFVALFRWMFLKWTWNFAYKTFDSSLQSYKVFEPAVGWHLLLLGGNIGEFYTSKYIYIGLYSLIVIPPLAVFSVRFCIAFCSFSFSCHFFSSSFLLQVQYFSAFVTCSTVTCYMFLRLLRTFAIFWLKFGCVCVCFDLTKFFIFCIFILSSVYTCKCIWIVSIHQPLILSPFGSINKVFFLSKCFPF